MGRPKGAKNRQKHVMVSLAALNKLLAGTAMVPVSAEFAAALNLIGHLTGPTPANTQLTASKSPDINVADSQSNPAQANNDTGDCPIQFVVIENNQTALNNG